MTDYQPRFAQVVNRNRPHVTLWCGPGALSILSGEDYDQIEERVNKLRYTVLNRRVKGMRVGEILDAINELGLVWVEVPIKMVVSQMTGWDGMKCRCKRHPTFIRWLRETREVRGEDVYFVVLADHVVVIKGEWVVDNTLKMPAPYELVKHYRRSRVYRAICILKDSDEGYEKLIDFTTQPRRPRHDRE